MNNSNKKKKLQRVSFIKPPKKEDGYLAYIRYGIKLFVSMVLSVISIPLTYIGVLTGMLVWILIGCLIVGGAVYVKVYPQFKQSREIAYDTLVHMKDSDFSMLSDTFVYDKDENLVGLVSAGHYEYAPIDNISMKIQNGYIAVEDKRFKTHPGFDWISITRAALALVKNDGEVTQGGSTITQQVIKNTYLTQEQTFTRKITEILLAPEVEKRYSKADIMEFYCNTNFYGHRCYGVESACNYYFGKSAADVEWWEAALLIGISNSPSAYDPIKHPEAALEKRNRVLATICKEGYFDESLLEEYQSKSLNIVQEYTEGTLENYQTSYAIHCAAIELMKNSDFKFQYTFKSQEEYNEYQSKYKEVYNATAEKIRSGGYKIYTTLDSDLQNKAQNVLDNGLSGFTERQENGKYAMQGAIVVVDNRTGYVVAVVGGRGDDIFNRAHISVRQPGSTIKPLLDYAPAFDTGEYYPSKIINDHKWEDGPSNAGGSYRGPITIREGLNRSLNTVAWQVLQGVGIENGLEYLGNMKFNSLTYVDASAEAISIGGFTNGVRVVDMAKGYSTLANNGVYNDRTCITSIISEKDGELYKGEVEEKQVYQPDTAYMITDILKGTMDKEYATGYGLDIDGQEAAGKTGTTNSSKDAWFCGYTRYYTTAVWMGYDTPKAMPGVYGATYSGRMWKTLMSQLHSGLERWDWDRPATVVDGFYNPGTGARVANDTGCVDMFSTNAEVRAEETRIERDIEKFNKAVEEKVVDFENYAISSVEETYTISDKFSEVMNDVSLIVDDTLRRDLGNRVATKYDELVKYKNSMQDAIDEYEQQKLDAEQALIEAEQAEAEAKVEEENLELRKAAFNRVLDSIYKLQYKQPDVSNSLVNKATDELKLLVDLDEYDELLKKLEESREFIKNLPTKAEWDKLEAARLIREEQERREAEEAKAREEEQRRQELEALRNAWNTEDSRNSLDGPGSNNSDSLKGPGFN